MLLRWLVPLVVSVGLALVLATADRYPTSPQVRVGTGSSQLVQSLNAAVQSVHSEIERFRLIGACELRVRPHRGEPLTANLMSVAVRSGSDPHSGELELYLEVPRGQQKLLLLSTESWPIWAAALSDINQLRARCARRLKKTSEPANHSAGA